MNWYYVEAGQQAGPVDDAQLEALVRSGRIQPDTLVWHEGMADWVAYQQVAPAPAPGAPPSVPPLGSSIGVSQTVTAAPPVGAICSECGRAFLPDEVIRYGDRYICAACKPVFFQRLQEGAALAGTVIPGTATEADLMARDYEVDIGGSLSRGFEVFKANMGIMIGASVLVYLAMMAANWVPYLNVVLALILTGPLMGGLWVFYIKKIRNQDAGVGDAFSGFGPRFWQLAFTQMIPGLVTVGFMLLFGIVFALTLPALAGSRRGLGTGSSSHLAGMLVPIAIVFVLFALAMIYLTTCWMFALPLVADKGLKFWPALELSRKVVSKHWWMTFGLLVVCGFLSIIGVFGFCVGILFTAPVAFATIVAHYEKVFGDLAPNPT